MIFKPILIAKILAGEKVVTRRPVNGDKPCAYKVGQEYSIQPGMARPTVARIRVASVGRERLGDITWQEAVDEGFAENHRATGQTQREDFLDYWHALYGGDVFAMLETPVWVIRFALVSVIADVCPCCEGKGVTELGAVRVEPLGAAS